MAAKERLATIQDMDNIEIRAAMRRANVLFVLNSDAPGLDDIKVREAFMTAIDRDQLASIRFNDLDYEEELPSASTLYQTQKANELEKEALSTFGIMPLMNGPRMVATNPKLANFGAKSLGSVEIENVGYVKE